MSKFRAAFERLTRRPTGDKLDQHNPAEPNDAFLNAIFLRLADPGPDGNAYRLAVSHWLKSPRPPLDHSVGAITLTTIDAPLLDAPREHPMGKVPTGGCVTGCTGTFELSPLEASELRYCIKRAIDVAVDAWLLANPACTPGTIRSNLNRDEADARARDQVTAWRPETADHADPHAPSCTSSDGRFSERAEEPSGTPNNPCCCEPGTPCAACKRERDHD